MIALVNLWNQVSGLAKEPQVENIGLGILASCLRQAGYDVQMFDAPSGRFTEIVDGLDRARTPWLIVGISCHSATYSKLVALAEHVKRRWPSTLVVAGGHFATFWHEEILSQVPALDAIVLGEAEMAIIELAMRVQQGRSLKGVPGIATRDGTQIVAASPPPPITNLDSLPLAARDCAVPGALGMTVEVGRGCRGACAFCSLAAFHRLQPGTPIRKRSAASIVYELRNLVREHSASHFWLVCDSFFSPYDGEDLAEALVSELQRAGLGITFKIESRVDELERATLQKLRQGGLRMIYLGVESAANSQLQRYNKQTTVESNLRALAMLEELDIDAVIGFILFDPDVCMDELRQNLEFLRDTRAYFSIVRLVSGVKAYRGTPLATRLCSRGIEPWEAPLFRGESVGLGYKFSDPKAALLWQAFHDGPLRNWCAQLLLLEELILGRQGVIPTRALKDEPYMAARRAILDYALHLWGLVARDRGPSYVAEQVLAEETQRRLRDAFAAHVGREPPVSSARSGGSI